MATNFITLIFIQYNNIMNKHYIFDLDWNKCILKYIANVIFLYCIYLQKSGSKMSTKKKKKSHIKND